MRTICNAAYFQSLSLVRMCLSRQARRGRPRRRSLISRVLNRENDGGDDDAEFPGYYGFLFLPSFLNLHSPLCLDIVLAGPRWSQPAPAYWQATRVPEQRYLENQFKKYGKTNGNKSKCNIFGKYLRWSDSNPRCSVSSHESELGQVTISLSRILMMRNMVFRKT